MAPTAEPEAIDLLELAGGTAVTKYAAGGAAALVLLILLFLVRRRHNR
jgi:LPXTG-motif cell wall-anchored protein